MGAEIQSRNEKAQALMKSGLLEEAIQEFRQLAAETNDDGWKGASLLGEARCYLGLGRLDNAKHVLDEIDKLQSIDDFCKMHTKIMRASLLAERGEHSKAELQYQEVIRNYNRILNNPEHRDTYEDIFFRRAIELANTDKYIDAVSLFKFVILKR